MSDERPAPLVTADMDVRDLDGFMLNVERLLASELWALSTGDELKAALALWCRAWKQVPAGSLPNDDRVLAGFSGFPAKWRKLRDMALRGFVLCSDGRLYHRTLCEDVRRAYQKKLERRERTKAATEARKKERDDVRNAQRNDTRDVERNVNRDEYVTTSQRQGQGRKERTTAPPVLPAARPKPDDRGPEPPHPAAEPRPRNGQIPCIADDGSQRQHQEQWLEIVDIFDRVRNAIYGSDQHRAAIHPNDRVFARQWWEGGCDNADEFEWLRDHLARHMTEMLEARKMPPNTIGFFAASVAPRYQGRAAR